MKVQISKWGNSLGVRLPKAVAEELALEPGQTLELVVVKGALELRPTRARPRYTLESLVAEMKRLGPENEPELVNWGPDVGAEVIDDAYSRGEVSLNDILGDAERAEPKDSRSR